MLIIPLKKMPKTTLGSYGPHADIMPDRMLYLAPEAADSFVHMDAERRVKVSDMYRDANGSLVAIQSKAGTLPPGYSGHGFGYSIDLDVDWMLKYGDGFHDKQALDEWMGTHGWWCHRTDHQDGSESWHYNFFGALTPDQFMLEGETRTSGALERKLQAVFGEQFKLSIEEAQTALLNHQLYSGDIDGIVGPHTEQAIQAFQRTWLVDQLKIAKDEVGKLGPVTQRILAFVDAQHQIVL